MLSKIEMTCPRNGASDKYAFLLADLEQVKVNSNTETQAFLNLELTLDSKDKQIKKLKNLVKSRDEEIKLILKKQTLLKNLEELEKLEKKQNEFEKLIDQNCKMAEDFGKLTAEHTKLEKKYGKLKLDYAKIFKDAVDYKSLYSRVRSENQILKEKASEKASEFRSTESEKVLGRRKSPLKKDIFSDEVELNSKKQTDTELSEYDERLYDRYRDDQPSKKSRND